MSDDDDGFDPDDFNPRRPRNYLAFDVNNICLAYLKGEYKLPEGKHLTAHFIAKLMIEQEGLVKKPSVGAITKVFQRWEEYGYATMRTLPYAFVDFTEEGKRLGFQKFMYKLREEEGRRVVT